MALGLRIEGGAAAGPLGSPAGAPYRSYYEIDPTADFTTELAAAIASERIVLIPPGTYTLDGDTIVLQDVHDLWVVGAGEGRTTLVLDHAQEMFDVWGSVDAHCDNVRFSDMTVDLNEQTGGQFVKYNCTTAMHWGPNLEIKNSANRCFTVQTLAQPLPEPPVPTVLTLGSGGAASRARFAIIGLVNTKWTAGNWWSDGFPSAYLEVPANATGCTVQGGYVSGAVTMRMIVSRSADSGATWSPWYDLGTKLNGSALQWTDDGTTVAYTPRRVPSAMVGAAQGYGTPQGATVTFSKPAGEHSKAVVSPSPGWLHLEAALATGGPGLLTATAYNAIPIASTALAFKLPSGSPITITGSDYAQQDTFYLSADVAAGTITTLPVVSRHPDHAHADGEEVNWSELRGWEIFPHRTTDYPAGYDPQWPWHGPEPAIWKNTADTLWTDEVSKWLDTEIAPGTPGTVALGVQLGGYDLNVNNTWDRVHIHDHHSRNFECVCLNHSDGDGFYDCTWEDIQYAAILGYDHVRASVVRGGHVLRCTKSDTGTGGAAVHWTWNCADVSIMDFEVGHCSVGDGIAYAKSGAVDAGRARDGVTFFDHVRHYNVHSHHNGGQGLMASSVRDFIDVGGRYNDNHDQGIHWSTGPDSPLLIIPIRNVILIGTKILRNNQGGGDARTFAGMHFFHGPDAGAGTDLRFSAIGITIDDDQAVPTQLVPMGFTPPNTGNKVFDGIYVDAASVLVPKGGHSVYEFNGSGASLGPNTLIAPMVARNATAITHLAKLLRCESYNAAGWSMPTALAQTDLPLVSGTLHLVRVAIERDTTIAPITKIAVQLNNAATTPTHVWAGVWHTGAGAARTLIAATGDEMDGANALRSGKAWTAADWVEMGLLSSISTLAVGTEVLVGVLYTGTGTAPKLAGSALKGQMLNAGLTGDNCMVADYHTTGLTALPDPLSAALDVSGKPILVVLE